MQGCNIRSMFRWMCCAFVWGWSECTLFWGETVTLSHTVVSRGEGLALGLSRVSLPRFSILIGWMELVLLCGWQISAPWTASFSLSRIKLFGQLQSPWEINQSYNQQLLGKHLFALYFATIHINSFNNNYHEIFVNILVGKFYRILFMIIRFTMMVYRRAGC